MSYEQPHQLTLSGIIKDVSASAALVLGTALVEYLLSKLSRPPFQLVVLLHLLEFTLVCFAAGYFFKAATYAWEQFAVLVERVATSKAWFHLAKLVASLLRFLLRGTIIIGVIAALWGALVYAFPDLWPDPMSRLNPWRSPYEQQRSYDSRYVYAACAFAVLTLATSLLGHRLFRSRQN